MLTNSIRIKMIYMMMKISIASNRLKFFRIYLFENVFNCLYIFYFISYTYIIIMFNSIMCLYKINFSNFNE